MLAPALPAFYKQGETGRLCRRTLVGAVREPPLQVVPAPAYRSPPLAGRQLIASTRRVGIL